MNARVRSRVPSTISTRKRTVDRAACNHETKALRELKYLDPMSDRLPTHIGIKRYFTPETMAFLRSSVRQGIATEREHVRLPILGEGEVRDPIALASNIHLDVLVSRRLDPKYAQGVIDGIRLSKMGAEEYRHDTPAPDPVIAKVKTLQFGEKGEVKMLLESEELVQERARLAEFLGRSGVKAYTYVKDEDPLEVIIARNRGQELTKTEGMNLISGIYGAMARLQSDTPAEGTILELKPWEYTKGIKNVVGR